MVFDVVNAANFGVPQRRERVVFVGFRADLGIEWAFPDPTHSLDALLWEQCRSNKYWMRHRVPLIRRTIDARLHARGMSLLTKPNTLPWRTTRDAIGSLPDPERGPHKIYNHKFQPGARSYPGHTGSELDEPAKTLKAGVHGVPGGENMLLKEDGTVRYFTVRESARLQMFPDNYLFHGSWTETMRQLGNAVPVILSAVIAKSVRARLFAAEFGLITQYAPKWNESGFGSKTPGIGRPGKPGVVSRWNSQFPKRTGKSKS